MPKRKAGTEEERWKKKIRKYEAKLKRNSSRIIYSSEEEKENDEPPPLQALLAPVVDEQLGVSAREVPEDPQPAAQEPEPVPGPSSTPTEPAQQVEISQTLPPVEPEIIDPELLQALGDFVSAEWGDDINDNLSKIWTPILKDGLKKETKEEHYR